METRNWNASRIAAARRHFRRAVALDPGNLFARGFLDRVSLNARSHAFVEPLFQLGCDVVESQLVVAGDMSAEDEDEEMVDIPSKIESDTDESTRPTKRRRSRGKEKTP